MSASVLRKVGGEAVDPHEREHVTLGIYRQPERFAIENVVDPSGLDKSQLRWTVDTAEDFDFVSEVYAALFHTEFEYEDVLELMERRPDLLRTESDAPRNAALDGLITGAMKRDVP